MASGQYPPSLEMPPLAMQGGAQSGYPLHLPIEMRYQAQAQVQQARWADMAVGGDMTPMNVGERRRTESIPEEPGDEGGADDKHKKRRGKAGKGGQPAMQQMGLMQHVVPGMVGMGMQQAVYAQTLEQAALGAYSPGGTARAVWNVVKPRPGQSIAKTPPRRGAGPRGAKNTCRFLVPNVIAEDPA